jgi:S-adenosylmethionine hydrolase
MSVITLTTDFGYEDSYVAAMKGVILGINPQATIVDVTHAVPPQDTQAGAFALLGAAPYFAKGSVHVAVVDPGVGSERRAIALQAGGQFFVGPDNGVLTLAAQAPNLRRKLSLVRPGSAIRGIHLLNSEYWLGEVSSTFHGRDIFAPVAAHLSAGEPFDNFGVPIEDYALIELKPPVEHEDTVVGEIIYIDRFGNLVSNILDWRVPEMREQVQIELARVCFRGILQTYADVGRGEPLALVGSSGFLEIAIRDGSAARQLGAAVGDPIKISLPKTA